jgi:hypothetical protein
VRAPYRDLITVVPDAAGALAALDATMARAPLDASLDLGKLDGRG